MKNTIAVIGIIVIVALFWIFAPHKTQAPVENEAVTVISEIGDVPVFITSPLPESIIESPLEISGSAPGYWFFEGDAPVLLTNWDGLIIAEGYITAQGNWMTEGMVEFSGSLQFDIPEYGDNGFLILQRDNPSGLPANDDAVEYQVFFK